MPGANVATQSQATANELIIKLQNLLSEPAYSPRLRIATDAPTNGTNQASIELGNPKTRPQPLVQGNRGEIRRDPSPRPPDPCANTPPQPTGARPRSPKQAASREDAEEIGRGPGRAASEGEPSSSSRRARGARLRRPPSSPASPRPPPPRAPRRWPCRSPGFEFPLPALAVRIRKGARAAAAAELGNGLERTGGWGRQK